MQKIAIIIIIGNYCILRVSKIILCNTPSLNILSLSTPHLIGSDYFLVSKERIVRAPITINVVLDDKVMGSCYASAFFRLLCLQSKRPFLTFCLCVKKSLGVKLFICKHATYTFIFIWIKLYFMWKVLQEDSLWSSQSITYKCNLFQRP